MTSDYRCSGRGAVLGEGARLWGGLLTLRPDAATPTRWGSSSGWPETYCCRSCWACRLAAMQRNHQGKTKGQNKGILVHKIPFLLPPGKLQGWWFMDPAREELCLAPQFFTLECRRNTHFVCLHSAVAPILSHHHFFASWLCDIQQKYANLSSKKNILISN